MGWSIRWECRKTNLLGSIHTCVILQRKHTKWCSMHNAQHSEDGNARIYIGKTTKQTISLQAVTYASGPGERRGSQLGGVPSSWNWTDSNVRWSEQLHKRWLTVQPRNVCCCIICKNTTRVEVYILSKHETQVALMWIGCSWWSYTSEETNRKHNSMVKGLACKYWLQGISCLTVPWSISK